MSRTKVRHPSHSRGEAGEDFVRRVLPAHWVTRKITPDYGLDLHIEVFDPLHDDSGWAQTAGEHMYAQIKTDRDVTRYEVVVNPRMNVAKFRNRPSSAGSNQSLHVISLELDVAEICTIEAMGSSVPVLLFWVDLESESAYYVCMNDYISKVLVPENPDFAIQKSVHVRIPMSNRISAETSDYTYFRLLSRRSKLYSAFNLFNYQSHEFNLIRAGAIGRDEYSVKDVLEILEVFVTADLRLDIWERRSQGWWAPLEDIWGALSDVRAQLEKVRSEVTFTSEVENTLQRGWDTLRRAANLGAMYEELVREWCLPTELAVVLKEIEDQQGASPVL